MKTFLILKLWAAVLKKKKSADSDNIVFYAEITLL